MCNSSKYHIADCTTQVHRAVPCLRMDRPSNIWCFGAACPWCILEADHGDYSEAQRKYKEAISGSALRERPDLANAAWHAISDIVEQAQRNGIDPRIPTLYAQPWYAVEVWPHAVLAPPVIAASVAASFSGGRTRHDGARRGSGAWAPGPPPKASHSYQAPRQC